MKFEEAFKRLNEISEEMKNNELPLEQAVALYSEAAKLVETCKKEIDSAKLTIKTIENNGTE